MDANNIFKKPIILVSPLKTSMEKRVELRDIESVILRGKKTVAKLQELSL